jgi:cytochrome o ubiquinol oxidase subunit 2
MSKRNKILISIFIAVDILLVLLCVALVISPPAIFSHITFFYPQGAIALQEKNLFITTVLIMLIAVVPVYFLIFFFAWKYNANKKDGTYSPNLVSRRGSGLLLWILPAGVIFILSFINWKSTHELDPSITIASNNPPLTIEVVALQWKYLFIYPSQNIATVNFIEFPVNTPLNFELTADAPMSSFWIPQLGSQIYAMAGMQTKLNLIANQTGDFDGKNTEINGDGFSGMKFVARSASQNDFNAWVKSVKASSATLNLNVYNELAAPSQNNPSANYASVDPGLYDTIMMKNMMPMTPEQMQQMSSQGMGSMGAMGMQGMDMK